MKLITALREALDALAQAEDTGRVKIEILNWWRARTGDDFCKPSKRRP